MGLRTWAEIDLKAIRHNLAELKRLAGGRMVAAAVKADAYGHGAVPVSKAIEDMVDFLLTATVDEAVELQDAGIKKPILVLGIPLDQDELQEAIRRDIRFNLAHKEILKMAAEAASKLGKKALVHMEIDTGMTRTGFDLDEAVDMLQQIGENSWIELEGVFTHFATADVDLDFARTQLERFKNNIVPIVRQNFPNAIIHAANSAAIVHLPEAVFDMVRPGISIYGLPPDPKMEGEMGFLKPAMSLKTRVLQVREIPKGVGISYGLTFKSDRPMKIATLAIGYGDGYPRILSNKAHFLIHGKAAPIRGVVCMDLTMVDVTEVPNVRVGDVAVAIGRDGDAEITATQLAVQAKTINYEIVTRVGIRAKRIYKFPKESDWTQRSEGKG